MLREPISGFLSHALLRDALLYKQGRGIWKDLQINQPEEGCGLGLLEVCSSGMLAAAQLTTDETKHALGMQMNEDVTKSNSIWPSRDLNLVSYLQDLYLTIVLAQHPVGTQIWSSFTAILKIRLDNLLWEFWVTFILYICVSLYVHLVCNRSAE